MTPPAAGARKTALTRNRYGRGKIHMGAEAVPYTRFAAPKKKQKRKVAHKMTLRYCPIPAFTDVTPIVFDGSGIDYASISAAVFPAGAPVPEALFHLILCGTWTVAPTALNARIVDENGDVVCALRAVPSPTGLVASRTLFDVATGIAGRGGLVIQISATTATTFTPSALGSSGLVFWDE